MCSYETPGMFKMARRHMQSGSEIRLFRVFVLYSLNVCSNEALWESCADLHLRPECTSVQTQRDDDTPCTSRFELDWVKRCPSTLPA